MSKVRVQTIWSIFVNFFFFTHLWKIKAYHKTCEGYYSFLKIFFFFFWKTETFQKYLKNLPLFLLRKKYDSWRNVATTLPFFSYLCRQFSKTSVLRNIVLNQGIAISEQEMAVRRRAAWLSQRGPDKTLEKTRAKPCTGEQASWTRVLLTKIYRLQFII